MTSVWGELFGKNVLMQGNDYFYVSKLIVFHVSKDTHEFNTLHTLEK